jgi:hypothetical protein
MLYILSFIVPPMGIIWGWKYIKQTDRKSRIVGYVAIGLTVVAIILAAQATMGVVNSVTSQVGQIQSLQGF